MLRPFWLTYKFWGSLLSVGGLLLVTACLPREQSKLNEVVQDYYSVYQQRSDFDTFLSFYDSSAVLEDIINGDKIIGKKSLAQFFNWNHSNFQLIDSLSLIIQSQIIQDNQVVTTGYFTPFLWGDYQIEAMYFTTILIFNDDGKIIKQRDWINYPSTLIDFDKRNNANEWINSDKR